MLIYTLYIIIILTIKYLGAGRGRVCVEEDLSRNDLFNIKTFVFILEFILLFCIFALRHQSMGSDLSYETSYGYLGSFEIISMYSWREIFSIESFKNYEIGYILFNKIVGSLYLNRQFFLGVTSFFILFPTFITIKRYSRNFELSVVILMGIPVFLQYFSGLRQAMAVALCVYSFDFIVKKNYKIFIAIIFFACTFHSSAIVFLIGYPLYHVKINEKIRWILLLLLPFIWSGRYFLFPVLTKIFNKSPNMIDTKSVNLLVFFVLIWIFCIIFSDEHNKLRNGLLNYFYVACFIQIFANVNNIAMRAGYYYIFFLTLLLPITIQSNKFTDNQKRWVTIGAYILFYGISCYLLTTSQSAKAVPYYFFWETPA